ncbi:hypothetical protein BU17DRAFT_99237 [Hysterangium stoloniferum]|nr:hypothetical protein BU17DRAFT_99237 [Hysterangium stoloniferum]
MAEQGQSQYAAVANVPLIKSPSLRVPPPVQLPPDIHPLPDDFVYPFTLEPHIVTLEGSRQATLAAHEARREAYLRKRTEERERRKRDALWRIAPGFQPQGAPLVPVKLERPLSGSASASTSAGAGAGGGPPFSGAGGGPAVVAAGRSVMDDLVDQLAAMDARAAGGVAQSAPTPAPAAHPDPSSFLSPSSRQPR